MPTYIGYDPGGNGKHGVAVLEAGSSPARVRVCTAQDGQDVLDWIESHCKQPAEAIGIDTLLSWEVSKSGWRGADLSVNYCGSTIIINRFATAKTHNHGVNARRL